LTIEQNILKKWSQNRRGTKAYLSLKLDVIQYYGGFIG